MDKEELTTLRKLLARQIASINLADDASPLTLTVRNVAATVLALCQAHDDVDADVHRFAKRIDEAARAVREGDAALLVRFEAVERRISQIEALPTGKILAEGDGRSPDEEFFKYVRRTGLGPVAALLEWLGYAERTIAGWKGDDTTAEMDRNLGIAASRVVRAREALSRYRELALADEQERGQA